LKHTVPAITDAQALQTYFLYHLGVGSCLPKQLMNQNWQGAGLGEHPKNFGTPIYFCNQWS